MIAGGAPTVLASFDGGAHGSQGGGEVLVVGNTIYGTTVEGGVNGDGEVFSLPIAGGTPTVLASFDGNDGLDPEGPITLSADDKTIYGTTVRGGPDNVGVVYSVPITGGTPAVLASFNVTNGPELGLALSNGVLYGTTELGGANGAGTVYAVVPEPACASVMLLISGVMLCGRRRVRTLSWAEHVLVRSRSM